MAKTLEQISKAYNKEGVCIPARFSKPAKVQGHDVMLCIYPVGAFCLYRRVTPSGNYCQLDYAVGKETKK